MSTSILDGAILDAVAAGKTPRRIAEELGISATEVSKRAYALLDQEIETDPEKRRKLSVYRMERIIESLWTKVQDGTIDPKQVANLNDLLTHLDEVLGTMNTQDENLAKIITEQQTRVFIVALTGLVNAFKALAPNIMDDQQWLMWTKEQMASVKELVESQNNAVMEEIE